MDKVKGIEPTKFKMYIQCDDEITTWKLNNKTWHKYLAKIGTTCSVFVWVNQAEVQVGDKVLYTEEVVQVSKTKYLSSRHSGMGIVDMINDEGRLFINKL